MYTVPVFNLSCNIWSGITLPPVGSPRVSSACNLAYGRRTAQLAANDDGAVVDSIKWMWLLLPKGTDIRGQETVSGFDLVEVPAGTGRFYICAWVDDAGKGFSNEHRVAIIQPYPGSWPTPIP